MTVNEEGELRAIKKNSVFGLTPWLFRRLYYISEKISPCLTVSLLFVPASPDIIYFDSDCSPLVNSISANEDDSIIGATAYI